MATDIDFDLFCQSFLAESEDDLAQAEQALLNLEKSPTNQEHIALVFRKFHTLKGSAMTLGFDRLSDFAHRIEDLLDGIREGREPVTQEVISFLLRAVDETRSLVAAATSGKEDLAAAREEFARRIQGGHLRPTVASKTGESAASAESGRDTTAQQGASQTLRIDVRKLDQLLNITSEIAIARGRLGSLIETHGTPDIAASYRSMERLLNGLHHFVTNVRMVPVGPLLRHFQRVVRDFALDQRKEAELVVTDQGVEVDTSVIEQIKAPLDQMIRNAVYHGIEPPARRKKLGKRPIGRIDLRARYEASGIVLEVEDDGAGLDRARILERARSLGLVSEQAALSDHEVDQLIFLQGLSTAKTVTSTSGRGVGMDVVLRNLSALGGSAEAKSRPGEGSLLTIRMPLTLAIIDGLLVRVVNETFVLPLAGVVQCLDLLSSVDPSTPDGVLNIRGKAVPFMRLRRVFSLEGAPLATEVVVIIEKGGQQVGIAVDRLLGKAQVVVKPPVRFFKDLGALSGMTILGNGDVAPILNVSGLFQHVSSHHHREQDRAAETSAAGVVGNA